MLSVVGAGKRLRDGRGRRHFLRLGSLSLFGLTFPELLARQVLAAPAGRGRAKASILFLQEGGLARQDTWDIQPDARAEVRGELGAIRTETETYDTEGRLYAMALGQPATVLWG